MGNSYSIKKDSQNHINDKYNFGTISNNTLLEKYIINFFKNYRNSNETKDISNFIDADRVIKNIHILPHNKIRACCTGSLTIPIALPYVVKNRNTIKYSYPLIPIFKTEKELSKNCTINKYNFKYDNFDINNLFATQNKKKNNNECTNFYNNQIINNKNYGFCKKVKETRSLSSYFPDIKNKVYGGTDIYPLDNKFNYKNNNLDIDQKYLNAYPDCNCINSIPYNKVKKNSSATTDMKNAIQQLGDSYCNLNDSTIFLSIILGISSKFLIFFLLTISPASTVFEIL